MVCENVIKIQEIKLSKHHSETVSLPPFPSCLPPPSPSPAHKFGQTSPLKQTGELLAVQLSATGKFAKVQQKAKNYGIVFCFGWRWWTSVTTSVISAICYSPNALLLILLISHHKNSTYFFDRMRKVRLTTNKLAKLRRHAIVCLMRSVPDLRKLGTLRIKQLRPNTLCFRTFQALYTWF